MAMPKHTEMYPLKKTRYYTVEKNDFPKENAKSFTTKEEQDAQNVVKTTICHVLINLLPKLHQ